MGKGGRFEAEQKELKASAAALREKPEHQKDSAIIVKKFLNAVKRRGQTL